MSAQLFTLLRVGIAQQEGMDSRLDICFGLFENNDNFVCGFNLSIKRIHKFDHRGKRFNLHYYKGSISYNL